MTALFCFIARIALIGGAVDLQPFSIYFRPLVLKGPSLITLNLSVRPMIRLRRVQAIPLPPHLQLPPVFLPLRNSSDLASYYGVGLEKCNSIGPSPSVGP